MGYNCDLSVIINAAGYEFVEMVDLFVQDLTSADTLTVELELADVDIIATYRNNDDTPSMDELLNHIEECADLGHIAKIITSANSSGDALNFLEALNSASQSGRRVTGYCVGDVGKHTQAMGIFYGSRFCYGVVDPANGEFGDLDFELDQLLDPLDTVIHGGDDVELMDVLKGKFS